MSPIKKIPLVVMAALLGHGFAYADTIIFSETSDGTLSITGTGDGGGTVGGLTSTALNIGISGSSGTRGPIFVFQLPSLGALANPFTSATFSVGLVTSSSTFGGFNADVYGLGARASSALLTDDAFVGGSDSTDATLLQNNWINFNSSTAPATGIYSVAGTALVDYLNAQYSGGAGAGQYVFIRVSSDAAGNNFKTYAFAASENTGSSTLLPQLSYAASTIPEPASAAWMGGLAVMAFVLFRRRKQ